MTRPYETTCPHCGRRNQAASALVPKDEFAVMKAEPVPQDGSISICAECGGFSIFSYMTPGGLRLPQPEERERFESSDLGQKYRRAMEDRP